MDKTGSVAKRSRRWPVTLFALSDSVDSPLHYGERATGPSILQGPLETALYPLVNACAGIVLCPLKGIQSEVA